MFSVGDVVDTNVPILACSENVLLAAVHLHVVERGLAGGVVAPRELQRRAARRTRQLPEDNGLVGAARHHLQRVVRVEEPDGRDRRRVVVQRL